MYPVVMFKAFTAGDNVASLSFAGVNNMLLYRFAKAAKIINSNIVVQFPIDYESEDIKRSRNGDHEAYRRLIESHQEYVGRIMWRFSRDKRVHEELVQDVFVEAYLSLDSFRQKAPFSHWLSTIATRVGYSYWKKTAANKKAEALSFEQWDQLDNTDGQMNDAREAAELLYKLLAQLPPRDRLVLTLRYLEDCDVAETAQRTGWTKTMVKVQTLRARAKLKKLALSFEKDGQ